MKTTLHAYHFNTKIAAEAAAWKALSESLTATHPHCMESHGGAMHYIPGNDGHEVELDLGHLFANQWNTTKVNGVEKGLRLFDWALDYNPNGNPYIKQGHYLDQTAEMREARRNTMACGYCGKQGPAQKGYIFCPHCLGSEYLKAGELRLTRMMPVDSDKLHSHRAELTEVELAHLLPLYREAQIYGGSTRDTVRIAKARADLKDKFAKAVLKATNERDGFTWMMDRGLNTNNLIYYSHTGRFCFGWRSPVEADVLSALLDVISEFGFPYDIKCADGRTLSGN